MAEALALTQLELANFKNHGEGKYQFGPRLSCITGLNGSGKTNLLDAIYLLALTKSRFQKADQDLISYEQTYYRVAGTFEAGAGSPHPQSFKVALSYQAGAKKTLKQDGTVVERFSDHIGHFPVVFINPDDIILVKGGAEERRKFFDNLLSQSSRPYLQNLLRYNRLLQQRGALLASLAERRSYDTALLDTYDEPLLALGRQLSAERARATQELLPGFAQYYAWLSSGAEEPGLRYESQLVDPEFDALFTQSRSRDIASGRTLYGVHRDEFELTMDGQPVRRVGSQGQQKTFLLALKLAMHDYLATRTGRQPILLLDDIFERLDEQRIAGLLSLIAEGRLGQSIITEATGQRMRLEIARAGLAHETAVVELGGRN